MRLTAIALFAAVILTGCEFPSDDLTAEVNKYCSTTHRNADLCNQDARCQWADSSEVCKAK